MVKKIMEMFCGKNKKKQIHKAGESKKIKGTVVLMKKNVLDATDMKASFFDRIHEFLGKGVSLQLISSTHPDTGHPLSLSIFLCSPSASVRGRLGLRQNKKHQMPSIYSN